MLVLQSLPRSRQLAGELGDKKRRKTLAALRESDVAIVVVDCARHQGLSTASLRASLHWEEQLLKVGAPARVMDVW